MALGSTPPYREAGNRRNAILHRRVGIGVEGNLHYAPSVEAGRGWRRLQG